jgi:hypothetical protein
MASLITISIDTKKFKRNDLKKGQYLNVTVALNDEVNDYGQNVAAWLSQDKEERENEEPRQYVGNGQVIWTDGNIFTAKDEEEQPKKKAPAKKVPAKKAPARKRPADEDEDDLPF